MRLSLCVDAVTFQRHVKVFTEGDMGEGDVICCGHKEHAEHAGLLDENL